MKKILAILLVTLSSGSFGQTYNKLSDKTKHKIDSTYTALIKKYKVVGLSLAIVDKDGIVYTNGYGYADLANKVKATDKTVYRIGSTTKSFTALSLMQLQEKHLLSTDSSVRKYLPDLKMRGRFSDGNPLYIRDILAHISGLPSDVSNGFFCDSPPDIKWLINELNKQEQAFPANYVHSYSNIGYGLLGEVVARLNNTSYSAAVKENVFKPLKMSSSYIELDPVLAADFSKAYVNNKEIKEPLIRDQAAGLIHSNALDMANYVRMYLNKGSLDGAKLVDPSSIDEMIKNRLGNLELYTAKNWGFGLYTSNAYSKTGNDSVAVTITGHGGDTYAFHTDMAFIPELGLGVVILTNSDKGAYINEAMRLLKIYLKNEKSIQLNTTKRSKPARPDGWSFSSANDIKGIYNVGNFVIKVKSLEKIKFKQGPVTIIFKPKAKDSLVYLAKGRVFGIVPIKIKGEEFRFFEKDNHVYLKQINVKSGGETFVAMKEVPKTIPPSWSAAFGSYIIKKDFYTCKKCVIGDPEGGVLIISEKDGFVTMKFKAKGSSSFSYLSLISENSAITSGIERGCGETVKILSNGNIYYSGFEFERK